MKKQFILITLLLLLLISSTAIIGCDYITGAALYSDNTPSATLTLPRDLTPEEAYGSTFVSSFPTYFLDVRTPPEYAAGHIPNAININYNAPDFKEQISQLDKTLTYIVYCQAGIRSARAHDIMEELGFQHVINMTGGYNDWLAAGLPVEE